MGGQAHGQFGQPPQGQYREGWAPIVPSSAAPGVHQEGALQNSTDIYAPGSLGASHSVWCIRLAYIGGSRVAW